MGLKGKFVRRDGTMAIFGSQKRPEWKPIDISSRVNAADLIPGEYYEMELENNSLVSVNRLEPRGGGSSTYTPGKEGGGYAKPAPPTGVDLNSLMINATGFAKSCLESGVCKTPAEAAQAGIRWAQIWGEVPKREATPAPSPPPPDPGDPDDAMPF